MYVYISIKQYNNYNNSHFKKAFMIKTNKLKFILIK